MAYLVKHDRLRAIMPDGITSIRPVLRINAEIKDNSRGYVELNTAVEKDEKRGWLNVAFWDNVTFKRDSKTVRFRTDFLDLDFTAVWIEGSCPAEKDNAGCFFLSCNETKLRKPETITANKEFCDCKFSWKFTAADASGESIGKTLPAYPEEATTLYPLLKLTAENAAGIPCRQVLGTYTVTFDRE